MLKALAYLLLPFSWLYGIIVYLRKLLYTTGIFSRNTFDFPIICVGNIAAGGTGKTPHIEWLIQQLSSTYAIGVISRGYKRKTMGYLLADEQSTAAQIGDEPFQIKRKFPETAVAVSENRVLGIPHLLGDAPETQVVLMDDGFQHLSVQAGYNIILTDYQRPFYNDSLIPAGLLRENAASVKRAQAVVVTKCPHNLTQEQQDAIVAKINPLPHQKVYFSCIAYLELQPITQAAMLQVSPKPESSILALSGIAKAGLFHQHLKSIYNQVTTLVFPDHVTYTTDRIQQLAAAVAATPNSMVITTEKDAVKLQALDVLTHIQHIPIWYIPIGVRFLGNQGEALLSDLKNYIETEINAINL
ncbi:MAG: tetraacyldisaccharide 4'-kinase [Bacteroidetes bacterium]|nr:MAG: tetraacyldisaccharide 4'-kinase [Bacteroidota bacterium]